MATIENKVKERLAAGQLALGLGLRQARTVDIGRILAACGYDWAFIDMEHNTMGIDTAAQIAVACHDAGVTPIVRVPGYEHYLATRLLDAGAMGIVFPTWTRRSMPERWSTTASTRRWVTARSAAPWPSSASSRIRGPSRARSSTRRRCSS
jgi:2-keto-3-deoxy-L-rhamnonate aldolase RhmA